MKAIWKFPIQIDGPFEIDMPAGAMILRVKTQESLPQMWALVEPMAAREKRYFDVHPTGHQIPNDDRRYLGTFDLQMLGACLVFHLFERSAP